jgi:hypothetical protein
MPRAESGESKEKSENYKCKYNNSEGGCKDE